MKACEKQYPVSGKCGARVSGLVHLHYVKKSIRHICQYKTFRIDQVMYLLVFRITSFSETRGIFHEASGTEDVLGGWSRPPNVKALLNFEYHQT